jgi:nicotinamidase-related amidase
MDANDNLAKAAKEGFYMMRPELLDQSNSALLLIDVQERLFPHIHEKQEMLLRIDLLLTAAHLLNIPVLATEQYPKGLGKTIPKIQHLIPDVQPLEKMDFSCLPAPGFKDRLAALQRRQIVVTGIETHVCVTQTVLDLLAHGDEVFVVSDATGSRRRQDAETALRRLDKSGAVILSAESVVFEWLRRAGTEPFKALQPKLKALV